MGHSYPKARRLQSKFSPRDAGSVLVQLAAHARFVNIHRRPLLTAIPAPQGAPFLPASNLVQRLGVIHMCRSQESRHPVAVDAWITAAPAWPLPGHDPARPGAPLAELQESPPVIVNHGLFTCAIWVSDINQICGLGASCGCADAFRCLACCCLGALLLSTDCP